MCYIVDCHSLEVQTTPSKALEPENNSRAQVLEHVFQAHALVDGRLQSRSFTLRTSTCQGHLELGSSGPGDLMEWLRSVIVDCILYDTRMPLKLLQMP